MQEEEEEEHNKRLKVYRASIEPQPKCTFSEMLMDPPVRPTPHPGSRNRVTCLRYIGIPMVIPLNTYYRHRYRAFYVELYYVTVFAK